jgi:phosphate butyryltransferase
MKKRPKHTTDKKGELHMNNDLKNFSTIIDKLKNSKPKKVAIAAAHDPEVLAAIRQVQDDGLAKGILTGDEKTIRNVASKHNISLNEFEIINIPDPGMAATKCCELIRKKEASAIMKGLLDTSMYMKAILNKETGLNSGKLISHVAAFEIKAYHKLLFVTDAAINISPTIEQKVDIINNAVSFSRSLGIDTPLVACCAAIEKVKNIMPATVQAGKLAEMSRNGEFKNAIVDGPFGLDNAVSMESARIKKIESPVAGNADIILCNDIESANYLYKSLIFLASASAGAIVTGANAPIILTSRADSHRTKYLSILLGLLNAKENNI